MPKLADQLAQLTVQGASDQELRKVAASHHLESWRNRADNTVVQRAKELRLGHTAADTVYSNPNLPSVKTENQFNWLQTKKNLAAKKVKGQPVTPEDIVVPF